MDHVDYGKRGPRFIAWKAVAKLMESNRSELEFSLVYKSRWMLLSIFLCIRPTDVICMALRQKHFILRPWLLWNTSLWDWRGRGAPAVYAVVKPRLYNRLSSVNGQPTSWHNMLHHYSVNTTTNRLLQPVVPTDRLQSVNAALIEMQRRPFDVRLTSS